MRNIIKKSGTSRVAFTMLSVVMAIFPCKTQKLLVERFDSLPLELKRIRVNK